MRRTFTTSMAASALIDFRNAIYSGLGSSLTMHYSLFLMLLLPDWWHLEIWPYIPYMCDTLHWLSRSQRIEFKTLTFMQKCLVGIMSHYRCISASSVSGFRSLCLVNHRVLQAPGIIILQLSTEECFCWSCGLEQLSFNPSS